jgi:predicted dehydrogenase
MPKKILNVGIVGHGFMGRAHANAYHQVNRFFQLGHQPILKVICGRDRERTSEFAANWGYESIETDWRR